MEIKKEEKLYVGTNYHPHDWTPARWKTDIQLMKEASFTVVRLGHLCWDSFEPDNGIYTFEWFDTVMNMFSNAGIGIFLDISTRPAPIWVHKECPNCNIFTKSGIRQSSVRRYMEDVDDPDFQFYAFRFARILVDRYCRHPALLGFGLCNELGGGYISYSEAARKRFAKWLEKKYTTIGSLNNAWATQRWSRRLRSFDDIVLPENEIETGSPEAYLDMRRFYSDGILNYITKLKKIVEEEAPGIPCSTNHLAENEQLGFDYLKGYPSFVDYPGVGFYPGINPESKKDLVGMLFILQHRIAETNKPMWCLEFQTGTFGGYAGPEGCLRMYAYLCLLYRTQMVLAWTFRSMLSGEEQYFFGLLDHDGTPGKKYEEFKTIAEDFRVLEKCGFPYRPDPAIAIGYNYENTIIFNYCRDYYKTPYRKAVEASFEALYDDNMDCNIVDLRDIKEAYKILIIPAHAIMDDAAAQTVRNFVKNGGTAVMTGYSAKVDGNNKVFETPQPGKLDDVFGIRVAGFKRTGLHVPGMFEVNFSDEQMKKREKLVISEEEDSSSFEINCDYYEVLQLKTAISVAAFQGRNMCAVSKNVYGKGTAYYTAAEPNVQLLKWLLQKICAERQISVLQTPEGIAARRISETTTFYVNTTSHTITVPFNGKGKRVLEKTTISGSFLLEGFAAEAVSIL